jgi:cytochrome c oxidase cbb3-type subunit 3
MTGKVMVVALALALAACQRETRDLSSSSPPEGGVELIATSPLQPGGGPPPPPDPRAKAYEGNAYAINQRARIYSWFNCVGCHAHGGGGEGPALMDDQWRYGDRIEQVYASIDQGRPNGMPAFHGKIPSQQIWQLAAYVKSLSGSAPSSAEGSRGEEMANIPSQTLMKAPKPKSDAVGVTSGAQ